MDTEHQGIWALVGNNNQKFLGRITAFYTETSQALEPVQMPDDLEAGRRLLLYATRAEPAWLCLTPAYDYFSPIRPVQVPGPGGQPVLAMTRDQMVMPLENFLHDAIIWVRATSIIFFDDLNKEDRAALERHIEQVLRQRTEARAKASGLVLATGIPPTGPRG